MTKVDFEGQRLSTPASCHERLFVGEKEPGVQLLIGDNSACDKSNIIVCFKDCY